MGIYLKIISGYRMHSSNPKVRDSQNPYKSGVLIGNHTEDKFGQDLASNPTFGRTGISEATSQLHAGNTMRAYPLEDKTQEHILEEAEFKDYHNHMVEINRGQPHHVLTGHGMQQAHLKFVNSQLLLTLPSVKNRQPKRLSTPKSSRATWESTKA